MLYLETPVGVGFSYSTQSSSYESVNDKITGWLIFFFNVIFVNFKLSFFSLNTITHQRNPNFVSFFPFSKFSNTEEKIKTKSKVRFCNHQNQRKKKGDIFYTHKNGLKALASEFFFVLVFNNYQFCDFE